MLCNNRKKEAKFAHPSRKFHSETAVVYNMRVRAHILEMISYTSYLYYYIFALVFLGLYFGNFIFLFFVLIFPRPKPKVKFLEKNYVSNSWKINCSQFPGIPKMRLCFHPSNKHNLSSPNNSTVHFSTILIHNTCVHFQPPGLLIF